MRRRRGRLAGAARPPQARRVSPSASPRARTRTSSPRAVERRTGTRAESLKPIPALVVDLPAGVSLRGISGVRYVEPLVTRHLAFTPTRSARAEAVVPAVQRLLRAVGDAVRRSSRSRSRSSTPASTPAIPISRGRSSTRRASSAAPPASTRSATGRSSRADRRGSRQRHRDRRARAVRGAPRSRRS